MNVAALLHDSPSDDRGRRQPRNDDDRQLPPPPPPAPQQQPSHAQRTPHHSPVLDRHRDRDREFERPPQDPPHAHHRPQQPLYTRSPSLRPPRPLSPPAHGSYTLPPEYGPPPPQRILPPPSSLVQDPYEHGPPMQHRRSNAEPPHPPGPQPYVLEHRPSSSATSRAPHHHHVMHNHAHTHPSTPSTSYMPPPPARPVHGSSPHHPQGHGPGQGSIPLYPTPVGPGLPGLGPPLAPPSHHQGPPPPGNSRFGEPSPMYGGPPPLHGNPSYSPHDRHRGRGASIGSASGSIPGGPPPKQSPAMASLQRPPQFDERERERDARESGPGSSRGPRGVPMGAPPVMLPGSSPALARPQESIPHQHLLPGPGLNPGVIIKDRERERGMEREREYRGGLVHGVPESPGARRERELLEQERQMKDRERAERHREREREIRERERDREQRELRERDQERVRPDTLAGKGMSIAEMEEREWMKRQQQLQGMPPNVRGPPLPSHMQQPAPPQGQVWPRFVPPRMGPSMEEERAMREMEHREMEMARREVEMRANREWEGDKPEKPVRQPRSRTTAKDREKVREEREVQKDDRTARASQGQREKVRDASNSRSRERPREQVEMDVRERERLVHEHNATWSKDAQREQTQRERHQRERDEEALRLNRIPHGQNIPLHPHQPVQPRHSPHKFAHATSHEHLNDYSEVALAQAIEDRFRHAPPKGAMSAAFRQVLGPPLLHPPTQLPPRRPEQHQHQHSVRPGPGVHPPNHHDGFPEPPLPGLLGYGPRRPSPPPHHSVPTNPVFAPQRPDSPRTALQAPTLRHLGTFIHPRTPFPFLDFPSAPAEPIDIRATLFFPSRFLPTSRPARPHIWGGGLIPAVPPLTSAQRQAVQQYGGGHPGYGRPEARHGRRVYTDDSDMFLCALHAGWITWSGAGRARKDGRDLKMEVRLTREARYIAGFGEPARGADGRAGGDDDGSGLLSAAWGNGHDGAGVEILKAEFVQAGTAHSLGLRNRSQRLLEYAERRAALGCGPEPSRKRRRLLGPLEDSVLQRDEDRADAELSATRTMVFGTDAGWPEIGFKYHPDALKALLFPSTPSEARSRKRRRASPKPAPEKDATSEVPPVDDDDLVEQRAIVVETLWESFLISRRGRGVADKENASDTGDGARRYVVALVTSAGGTAGRLPATVAGKTTTVNGAESAGADPVVAQTQPETTEDAMAVEPPQPPKTEVDVPMPAVEEDPAVSQHPTKTDATPPVDATMSAIPPPDAPTSDPVPKPLSAAPAVALVSDEPPAPIITPDASAPIASTSIAAVPVVPPTPSGPSLSSTSVAESEDVEDASGPVRIFHRDLGVENFEFLPDGINILSGEAENGWRRGWKIEARQWKWVQVGIAVS